MEISKREHRAVIKFLFRRGCTATVIHKRLVASSRDPLGLYTQVTKNWFHGLLIGNKLRIHHWD